MEENDQKYMQLALDEAREAAHAGEVPVGAVVTLDGQVIARASNRTLRDCDPTAHAEIVALRAAARAASNHRILGPSWMDVSKRYKGQTTYKYSMSGSNAPDAKTYPLVDGLVMKISRGGAGNWGSEPMISNNALRNKQGEIRRIVQLILGLDK